MSFDAFDAGFESADSVICNRPARISASMHADLLSRIAKDPFPFSSAMHAVTTNGKALGFIYRVRLVKALLDEYALMPTQKECVEYMYHPVFIAAMSEIEPDNALKSMLLSLDSTYFQRFILKGRIRNYL